MIDLATLWIVSGVVSALVASMKRRSGFAHFAAGMAVPPLWVLVLLLLSKGGAPCHACREPVDRAATICPHCRTALEPAA